MAYLDQSEVIVSTDKTRLELDRIHAYISERSYWGKGRSLSATQTSIGASLCFGLYNATEQLGFARVVTDKTIVAYILDLFVFEAHQGQGLGKYLVEAMLNHEDLQTVTWLLATRDTHTLYERYGFVTLEGSRRYMVRAKGRGRVSR